MTLLDNSASPPRGWTLRRIGLLLGVAVSAAGLRYHIMDGTAEVMAPVYASDLPREAAAVLDLIWWQVSALIAGGGIAMAVAAFRPEWRRPVAWLVGGHYLVIAAICLVCSFMWFGTALGLTQWIIFGALGLLMAWAARD